MTTAPTNETKRTMRQEWFEHVRKVRTKMSRGKKEPVSHRLAMQQASTTWADAKGKIERRNKREAKKASKEK